MRKALRNNKRRECQLALRHTLQKLLQQDEREPNFELGK